MTTEHKEHCCGGSSSATSATEQDPVCKMSVDPATSQHSFVHGGKTYYFCCKGCLRKFAATPEAYLAAG